MPRRSWVGSFGPMTAYSGLRLIASASGLLSRLMPRADSRNAAGVFSALKGFTQRA
jgi:hypothetical protein